MKNLFAVVLSVLSVMLCCACGGQQKELKLMCYNIRAGRGMDNNFDLQRTASVIISQDPDFVGLQEVDSVAARTGLIDEAAELGRLTGMKAFFAGAIPYSEGKYGVAVLCKEEPLSVRSYPLPGAEEERTVIFLEFKKLVLANTHFSLTKESRAESVAIITDIAAAYSKPVIICGDFNMEPSSEVFATMTENWQVLSEISLTTFPASEPSITIDYFWGLKGFNYNTFGYSVLDEPLASDHRPLVISLGL